MAVNATGWPIAWEIFPGNTADQKALGQVVALLRQWFHIRRVTVVADRGMISRDTITMLIDHQEAPFDYVLGGPEPKSPLAQLIFLVKEQMQAFVTAITNFFSYPLSCYPFELKMAA